MGAAAIGTEARTMQIGNGDLTIENDNGIARVILRGDFDLSNVPELERRVSAKLWPAYHVLVDLQNVTYLDAQLLHWLRRLQRQTEVRNGRLAVVPSARLRHLLAAVGLSGQFDLVEA